MFQYSSLAEKPLDQWEIATHWRAFQIQDKSRHCDPHLDHTKFNGLLPLTIDGVLTKGKGLKTKRFFFFSQFRYCSLLNLVCGHNEWTLTVTNDHMENRCCGIFLSYIYHKLHGVADFTLQTFNIFIILHTLVSNTFEDLIFAGTGLLPQFLLDLSPIIGNPCQFSRLNWFDPGVWRCQFKTYWGCYCCWCWCRGSCWQQFVADLGTEVWS